MQMVPTGLKNKNDCADETNSTLLTCPPDDAHSSLMQKINKLLFDSRCFVTERFNGLQTWMDSLDDPPGSVKRKRNEELNAE
jgi:hypothetical protein